MEVSPPAYYSHNRRGGSRPPATIRANHHDTYPQRRNRRRHTYNSRHIVIMSTINIGSSGEWDKLLSGTTVVIADCIASYLPLRNPTV